MTKQATLADPLWENYPELHHLAAHLLDDEQTANLLQVIANATSSAMLRDVADLDRAFCWASTKQMHSYWSDVHNSIDYDTLPALGTPAPCMTIGETQPTGWQPDIVDGASVMDITRTLF